MRNKTWLILLIGLIMSVPSYARSLFLQVKEPEQNVQAVQAAAAEKPIPQVSYQMQRYYLKYANATDIKAMVSDLLAAGEAATSNDKLNTVIIRASAKTIASVDKVIKQVDIAPLQVQVEAKIIELKKNDGDSTQSSHLGLNAKYTSPNNPNNYVQQLFSADFDTDKASEGMYAQLISGNVQAYLSALQREIGYNLIASPWVSAINHEQAEILIGSKYGYQTSTTTQTTTVQTVNFLEVGTKLRFTPHINEDGYVIMEIYPSVSEGTVTNNLPQENTTETKNKVLVKDGQSIVIGGLTKENNSVIDSGFPIISQIPFLGALFRRTDLIHEKRELMVIITPHIVTPQYIAEMSKKADALNAARAKAAAGAGLIH